jgi:hypothetical protein
MGCTCGSSGAIDGHSPFCALRAPEEPRLNRVVVGLPERVESRGAALREHEKMVENVRTLVAQRDILRDSVVLDQIGELLGIPKPRRSVDYGPIPGHGCPACGPGHQTGPFCSAHRWHES